MIEPTKLSRKKLFKTIKRLVKKEQLNLSDEGIKALLQRVLEEDGQMNWYEVLETPAPHNFLLVQVLLNNRMALILENGFQGTAYGVFFIDYREKKISRLSMGTREQFRNILFSTQADAERFAAAWREWNPEDTDPLHIEEISRRRIKTV